MNIRKMSDGQRCGKLLMKELLKNDFSDDFIYRSKQGFSVPLKNWFADENVLAQYVKERCLSSGSFVREYFNESVLKEVADKNITKHIWLLIFLEEWLSQNG